MEPQELIPAQKLPDTRWSLIMRADNGDTFVRRNALDEILRLYTPALEAHLVLQQKFPPEQVEDLLQGFIADKMLEQMLLSAADQSRGRFRNFLLSALDHYVVSNYRHVTAAKRRPEGGIRSLTSTKGIADPRETPADTAQVAWARTLLDRALKLMQDHCCNKDRDDIWKVFEARILKPIVEDTKPASYEQLVAQLGFDSPGQAANALITAKRMFRHALTSAILEYESKDAVEAEIAELKCILCTAGSGKRYGPLILSF